MTPQAGVAPLLVTWGGAASDPDGPSHTLSYAWDLDGDGTDDTTVQYPTFTYSAQGTYMPRVRVTDPFGGSTTRTFVVNVIPEARDPNARFRILVFSKTTGFRHSSIDEGVAALKLLGSQNGIQVDPRAADHGRVDLQRGRRQRRGRRRPPDLVVQAL